MGTPSDAFGWGRSYEKQDISGAVFTINGLEDGAYRLSWTDPWSGKVLGTEKVKSKNGKLILAVPALPDPHPDVAFRLLK